MERRNSGCGIVTCNRHNKIVNRYSIGVAFVLSWGRFSNIQIDFIRCSRQTISSDCESEIPMLSIMLLNQES